MSIDTLESADGQEVTASTYELDLDQTTNACKVLLKHIREKSKEEQAGKKRPNLLAGHDSDSDAENDDIEGEPIWLMVATKKHVSDKRRLIPGRVSIPHHLNSSPTCSVCLITADPQSLYKEAIEHPSFPDPLRRRVARVISLSNLKAQYKPYENRRQLLAEHDIFLADERIVSYLPNALGKIFYRTSSKRPIPVKISGNRRKGPDGKPLQPAPSEKKDKIEGGKGAAHPMTIAKEVERALSSALIQLSPGVSSAVRIGLAGMKPEAVCENIDVVVQSLVEKYIPQGWRNIRALHIKGTKTMAFPIWQTDELWVGEEDVLEERKVMSGKKSKEEKMARKKKSWLSQAESEMLDEDEIRAGEEERKERRKRKADETDKPSIAKHAKKKRRSEETAEVLADMRERAQKHKAAAMASVGGVAL